MNFVAIDFETANEKRASACAVGMVRVRDGQIVDRLYSLLKPEPLHFLSFNSNFHGITEADVLDAPTFADYFPVITDFIGPDYVVAHNAPFDKGVLSQSFAQIGQTMPNWTFICTYRLSKRLWQDWLMYSLSDVCTHLDIELTHHHNALCDAEGAALVLLKAIQESGKTPDELHTDIYQKNTVALVKSISATTDDFDESHPFYGKSLAITGEMVSPRREIVQILVNLGAIYHDTFQKTTNFLVTGVADVTKFRDGNKSTKMKKAEKFRADGCEIEMIDENQFWSMV